MHNKDSEWFYPTLEHKFVETTLQLTILGITDRIRCIWLREISLLYDWLIISTVSKTWKGSSMSSQLLSRRLRGPWISWKGRWSRYAKISMYYRTQKKKWWVAMVNTRLKWEMKVDKSVPNFFIGDAMWVGKAKSKQWTREILERNLFDEHLRCNWNGRSVRNSRDVIAAKNGEGVLPQDSFSLVFDGIQSLFYIRDYWQTNLTKHCSRVWSRCWALEAKRRNNMSEARLQVTLISMLARSSAVGYVQYKEAVVGRYSTPATYVQKAGAKLLGVIQCENESKMKWKSTGAKEAAGNSLADEKLDSLSWRRSSDIFKSCSRNNDVAEADVAVVDRSSP